MGRSLARPWALASTTPRSVMRTGDEAGGRYVKRIIPGGTGRWRDADPCLPARISNAVDMRYFVWCALLDRNLGNAVIDGPVDGGGRQGNIKRHVVILGGKGLQICADLVANITVRCRSVRSSDAKINKAVLHEVPPSIVDDYMMGDAMGAKLPGSQRSALVTGAGFVHPNMHRNTSIMGFVDGGQGCAPVHGRDPSGITVGQDVDGGTGWLGIRNGLNDRQAMAAYGRIDRDVFLCDGVCFGHRGGGAGFYWQAGAARWTHDPEPSAG